MCCWKIYNNMCIIFILILYLIRARHYTMNEKWFAPIKSFRFFNGDRNISIKSLWETRCQAVCLVKQQLNSAKSVGQKNDTDDLYLQNRSRDTDIENKHMDIKRGWRGGMNWEIGTDTYTLLCIKQVTNENLMYIQVTLLSSQW